MFFGLGRKKTIQRGRRGTRSSLVVQGMEVEIVRRRGRTIRFSVKSPDGRVVVGVPPRISDADIIRVIQDRWDWIAHHRIRMKSAGERYHRRFGTLPGEPLRIENDTAVRLFSRRYRVRVLPSALQTKSNVARDVRIVTPDTLEMRISARCGVAQQEALLWRWYRIQLDVELRRLVRRWEQRMGVTVKEWKVRRMKSRWGSCHTTHGAVTFNLELVRRPKRCLEFVVVHELVHLLERGHTKRFYHLMDQFLPAWRMYKAVLDAVPLPKS